MTAYGFRRELFRRRLQLPCVPYHGLPQLTVDRFADKIATVFCSQHFGFQEPDGLISSLRDLHATGGVVHEQLP